MWESVFIILCGVKPNARLYTECDNDFVLKHRYSYIYRYFFSHIILCVAPNCFLKEHQSYWLKAHPKNLILPLRKFLKYSWSTMLCQFLLYSKVTQLCVYILFNILFHYGLSQEIGYTSLCYTAGSHDLSFPKAIVCIY